MPPEKTSTSRGIGDGEGLIDHLRRFIGNFLEHLQALGALAGLEGREASQRALKVLIAIVAGILFLSFGYVLFVLFLVFSIVEVFKWNWLWVALGFSIAHFLLALAAACILRRQFIQPFFPSTTAEIRKDIHQLKGES
ncbi:MAG: phage holin family protein [Chthoniobacterales bacterium]